MPYYHWKRRAIQIATILLVILIPISGLFRIDLPTASFTIFDQQVWWSNFSLVFGLAIMLATVPIITYMTIGTVWCGWACPQNTLSEWANNLTHRLLGKRASVDIDASLQVAAAKNKVVNWIILALVFLGAALLLAIVPFLYFYPPGEVWAFITFGDNSKLARFMHQLYFVAVLLVFLDIAVIRYFWCDYVCLYRIGQRIFRARDALHIEYDASRASNCAKCNYCAASCITGINPTRFQADDSCINCGECIDACNRLHAKESVPGLLKFEFGGKAPADTWRDKLARVFSRLNRWVAALFLLGCAMFAWGVFMQEEEAGRQQAQQELQQKAGQLAESCKGQCSRQQASCAHGILGDCYRAAACQCQCYLNQDPANPLSGEWHQCVQRNLSKAETTNSKIPLMPR